MALQNLQQLRLDHYHALHERSLIAGLFGGSRRPLEIIKSGQQVRREAGMSVFAFLHGIALRAFLIILEIGLRPFHQIQVFIALLFGRLGAGTQSFQVVQHRRGIIGAVFRSSQVLILFRRDGIFCHEKSPPWGLNMFSIGERGA